MRGSRPAWGNLVAALVVVCLTAPGAGRAGHDARALFRMVAPGPPARVYATTRPLTSGQRRLQAALDAAGFHLQLDAGLCRAAHAYAMALPSDTSEQPPMSAVEFLLHRAGCPDATASATVIYTTEDGWDEVVSQLRTLLRQPDLSRSTHVGLAQTRAATAPYRWRWGVYLVTRHFALREIPLATATGRRLPFHLTLDPGLADPEVLILGPGAPVRRLPVGFHRRVLTTVVETGHRSGKLWIEVVAEGLHGPQMVALFPIWVDRAVPSSWEGPAAPREAWIHSPRDAQDYLFTLVNRDRRTHGLPPLVRDDALTAVAGAHSQDMVRAGYFGHRSPTHGGLARRLESAGYRALWAGENVARAGTIEGAEEALMRSPGHRANILSPKATHLGVGVAAGEGENRWFVTQIFARPAPSLDEAGWADALSRRLDAGRLKRGLPQLVWSPELTVVAKELLPTVTAGRTSGRSLAAMAEDALKRRGSAPGRLLVRTAELWTPDQLPPLEPDLDWAENAGLAVAIPRSSSKPVTVLLLLTQP